jgi:hypothetical protein
MLPSRINADTGYMKISARRHRLEMLIDDSEQLISINDVT